MRLATNGFPVPPGVCLSSASHAAEPATRADLVEALSQVASPWAIRSSSLTEDTRHRAFPGIYNTVLGVESLEGVINALCQVGSVPDAEVLRVYSPGDPTPTRVPALIQTIYDPRAAGVLFTNNPISLSDSLLINASWGLGKPVVDGTVTPDQFEVDRTGRVLSAVIAMKDTVVDSFGKAVELPPDVSRKPCLGPQELASLAQIAIKVEQLMGGPQDIEWMQDQTGLLWLVQTRPITTL
ncbi:MAG TPA: PEP/pyruvate-binding domain-containing protein [Actinophytocola sp.]|uniref:PEP/pyruvate-binding domain-containing protein n=1 Tax=Actinophytocola sp. TaxID=1872138 RepID=UPI002DDD92A2|nr:PEP/pyruvate-binding domain-containing protein [Actinophytocola sp.]HEV2778884.1 PEP/pyruvate-binding domain-containing protein [Actinophytocola sp.]